MQQGIKFGTLGWYHIHKDTQHTQGSVVWQTHINIYLHYLLCAYRICLSYSAWIIHWYQKFTFHNVFSFQKLFTCKSCICWLDTIRLGSFCKTNNTDRNGVNKHTHTHTHTHTPNCQGKITLERVSMKISDTLPSLFYQPFPFYGKNMNPPFSKKFWKLKLYPMVVPATRPTFLQIQLLKLQKV